jgi:hypothetical protein
MATANLLGSNQSVTLEQNKVITITNTQKPECDRPYSMTSSVAGSPG